MFNEEIDLTSFVGQTVDAATWAKLIATSIARHGPSWAWQAMPLESGGLLVTGVHITHRIEQSETEKNHGSRTGVLIASPDQQAGRGRAARPTPVE